MTTRLEHDLLGEREIPANAYWGIHTLRAIENFPITGVPIGHYRSLVRGLGFIKEASAKANLELDVIPQEIADPIIKASIEVRDGLWDGEFTVDAIQGGAGTSTNMNANEVIANRALEIAVPPRFSSLSSGMISRSLLWSSPMVSDQAVNSWPKVIGTASCNWVRPILITSLNSSALASMDLRRYSTCFIRARLSMISETLIAVG